MEVVMPMADGTYTLDVANAPATGDDFDATVCYGFGLDPADPVTCLNVGSGLSGGTLDFVVEEAPVLVMSWKSMGNHGALGELGLEIPECPDETFSEPRNSGINKIVVEYDKPVDASAASVAIDGCYATGDPIVATGNVANGPAGPPYTVVITFNTASGELPGNECGDASDHASKYAITLSGVAEDPSGAIIADETRILNAVGGDSNDSRSVTNFDLAAVRNVRDGGGDAIAAIRADVNNSGSTTNFDLAAVRACRDAPGRTNSTTGVVCVSCP
jgi:hypothetical protein